MKRPQRVREYEIKEKIGVGRYGTAFRAFSQHYKTDFCIKVIDNSHEPTPTLIRYLFNKEAETLRLVGHPNVVRLYDYFEYENQFYIVLEYCPKGSFKMKLDKTGVFDLNEIRVYFTGIVEAIAYFHSLNVVHRDLKPANFAFDKINRPKILDWGFSTQCKEGELLNTYCGSHPYIPPECVLREPYDGKMCDMWALGISIYMCAFNRNPWVHDTEHNENQQENLLTGKLYMPFDANPVLADLLNHLIQVDPLKRLSAEQVLDHPFFQGVRIRPIYKKEPYSAHVLIPKLKSETIFSSSRTITRPSVPMVHQVVSHKRIHNITTF